MEEGYGKFRWGCGEEKKWWSYERGWDGDVVCKRDRKENRNDEIRDRKIERRKDEEGWKKGWRRRNVKIRK